MNPVSDLIQCTISITSVNYKSRVRKHVQVCQFLGHFMQLCTVPEDNRSHPKEVTVYLQKISIPLPRKVSILRPSPFHSGNANKASYISLDFFWSLVTESPIPSAGVVCMFSGTAHYNLYKHCTNQNF